METNKFYKQVERKKINLESFVNGSKDISCIYHYTNPEAFKNIIINRELYLSNINFLNDKEENNYIYKVLGDIISFNNNVNNIGLLILIILCIAGVIDWTFFEKIKNSNFSLLEKETIIKEYFTSSCKKPKINKTEYNTYCFSASLKKDSIPMWNYYIKNNNYYGYNIGFNLTKLTESISKSNITIYKTNIDILSQKIIYDINEQKNIILKILNDFIISNNIADISKIYENHEIYNKIFELKDKIVFKGVFFKDKSFSHEEEYRIAIRVKDTNNKESKDFFIKNGIFVPYIKIYFNKTSIDSITIAPLVEKDIAKKGLEQFLIKHNYKLYDEQTKTGIKIETSNCPIRY